MSSLRPARRRPPDGCFPDVMNAEADEQQPQPGGYWRRRHVGEHQPGADEHQPTALARPVRFRRHESSEAGAEDQERPYAPPWPPAEQPGLIEEQHHAEPDDEQTDDHASPPRIRSIVIRRFVAFSHHEPPAKQRLAQRYRTTAVNAARRAPAIACASGVRSRALTAFATVRGWVSSSQIVMAATPEVAIPTSPAIVSMSSCVRFIGCIPLVASD